MRYRIATFNLENFDETTDEPSFELRAALMRPQLLRLQADLLCLQEVNGQERPNQPRDLLALRRLLVGTPYASFNVATTKTADGRQVFDERNLVILSRLPFLGTPQQIKHQLVPAPQYRRVTALPPDADAVEVTWERPILYAQVQLPSGAPLHVLNLHLKSRIPSAVPGQQLSASIWRSASGWAEGSFISAMKRVGQALETRILVDQIFDREPSAAVVVAGDFNADLPDVPLLAIRGDVNDHGNDALITRLLVPCERTLPEPSRFSLIHQGSRVMLDHLAVSRTLLTFYQRTEIHNEALHDESTPGATDRRFPESDHAPVVAEFEL